MTASDVAYEKKNYNIESNIRKKMMENSYEKNKSLITSVKNFVVKGITFL